MTKKDEAQVLRLAVILKALLASWQPHETQWDVLHSLLIANVKFIFIECGRKWGKTELICFVLWLWCLAKRDQHCYYIAPYAKQAREIIWVSNRLQTFGPAHYIKSTNNTEMRLTFTNGSFIKIDGSDNHGAYRGINPHFIVYDEFKDHNVRFHEAMEPNLATYQAPLIVLGTPPETEDTFFVTLADFAKAYDYRESL